MRYREFDRRGCHTSLAVCVVFGPCLALESDLDDSIGKVEVVPQDLGRVILNPAGNALDALNDSGSTEPPTVSMRTLRRDGEAEIRIADNGPGIREDIRKRIFEPFFTTKPTGSGTGLGLSISCDIVTKGHGGTMDVESAPDAGTTLIVRFPV